MTRTSIRLTCGPMQTLRCVPALTHAPPALSDRPPPPPVVRQGDGKYTSVAPARNVLQLLQDLGQFSTLLAALKVRARARATAAGGGRVWGWG
jgi:hypothetical protein